MGDESADHRSAPMLLPQQSFHVKRPGLIRVASQKILRADRSSITRSEGRSHR